MNGPSSKTNEAGLFIVLASGLVCWIAFKLYTGILLEDALITFRYAENLASGLGFTYNPGEAVLGTTSPLLTLVLAAAGRVIGIAAIPRVAAVTMAAASAGTAIFIALLVQRSGNVHLTALAAAVVFCMHPTTLWMTTGGMETPLVLLLMSSSHYAASAGRWNLTACLLALLVITRIDGAVWALVIFAWGFFRERGKLIWPAILGGTLVALWLGFATVYFGNPVPQSLLAKQVIAHATGTRNYVGWGVDALGFSGRESGIWLVFVAVESVAILTGGPASLLLPLVLYPPLLCAAYWLAGAPLEFPWYAVPITLCGLVLGVCGAERFIRAWCAAMSRGAERTVARAVGTLLVALLVADLVYRDYQQFLIDRANQANENGLRRTAGEWLANTTPPHATVAMEAIGYTGTYAQRRVIDLAGLISPDVVAVYKSSSSHAEAFERVLLALRPDFLVLRSFEVDTNEHYHGGRLFETEHQRLMFDRSYVEAARFAAPYPDLWGRLSYLTVYKRRIGA